MWLKTQVIINPESDYGRTRKRWKQIKESLQSFLKEFKYEFTEKPLHATEIARTAIKEGSELIVGVGGDGTMNEIANGFYENMKIVNPETALGIVPSGSGCDFTKSLNIPSGIKDSLKFIFESPSTPIDIGRATFQSLSGKQEKRLFLNIADFGFGGEVVKNLNQKRVRKKTSSYLRCMFSTIFKYKKKRLKLKIDQQEIPEDEYLIGAVANGKIFGKGMRIAPQARLDDGLFDLVLVKSMRLLEFFCNCWKVYTGTHLTHPKISLIRGKKIKVIPHSDEDEVLIELDGELPGKLPATFEIVPHSFLVKGYI
jgi:diacylglycerol kinase (ATP)